MIPQDLRSRPTAPAPPVSPEPGGLAAWRRGVPAGLPFVLPAAAIALIAVLAAGAWLATRSAGFSSAGWDVQRLAGSPLVASRPIETSGRLEPGDWVETDPASRARLSAGRAAGLIVEPGTRLKLVESGPARQRFELALGTLHARVAAPPGVFTVEIPSALVVDLGCAYTLQVDDDGGGGIRVVEGWVGLARAGLARAGLQRDDIDALVPAGARCVTRPALGPGTPYAEEASEDFLSALALLDTVREPREARSTALARLIAEARPRDALTLWHLMARGPPEELPDLFEGLAGLVPPPPGVTLQGISGGDEGPLDAWWQALGLRGAPLPRGRKGAAGPA